MYTFYRAANIKYLYNFTFIEAPLQVAIRTHPQNDRAGGTVDFPHRHKVTIPILLDGTERGTSYTQILNHEVDGTIISIIISISIAVMIESFFIPMTVLPRSTDNYSFGFLSRVKRSYYCISLHPSVLSES